MQELSFMFFLKNSCFYSRYIVILLFTSTIIACSHSGVKPKDDKKPQEVVQSLLFSHQGWKLEKIRNKQDGLIKANPEVTSSLFFQNDRVTGKAGCNDYFGNYQFTGNNLVIKQVASTMAMCPEPFISQERELLAHLENVSRYQIVNQKLQLFDKKGELNLVFNRNKVTALLNTEWQLLAVNTGNALVSNLSTEVITAKFGDDNKIRGFAGCNIYSAVYKTEQALLTISLVVATRKLCQTPKNAMKIEGSYISALGKSMRYQIIADRLTLFDKNQRRMLTYKKKF